MRPDTSRTEIAGADWYRRGRLRAWPSAPSVAVAAVVSACLVVGNAHGGGAGLAGAAGAGPAKLLGAPAPVEGATTAPGDPFNATAGPARLDGIHSNPSGPATLDDTSSNPSGPAQFGRWQGITLAGATCGGPPDTRSGERPAYKYYLDPATVPGAGILFLLSGGGACMKDGPAPAGVQGIAAQLHCMSFTNFRDQMFTDAMFALDAVPGRVVPYLDRGNAGNPFREWTYVAVPYCTGDVHAGSMAEAYDYDPTDAGRFLVLHRGHLNFMAVLDDVAGRFPGDVPVVLSGMSAGGFGAIFNFPDVVARYPHTTLLPDAGIAPPAPTSLLMREGARVAARWGADTLLPGYCRTPDCLGDSLRLFAAHAARFDGRSGRPWLAFGLLQGQQDGTLSDYLEISRCSYQQGLRTGLSTLAAMGAANVRVYAPATSKHVFSALNPLTGERPFVSAGGVDAHGWFKQVALASSPDTLPPSVIDGWGPCNPTFLPFGIGELRR